MAEVVRVALDVVVDKGNAQEVAEAIYESRAEILGFITGSVLQLDEKTEGTEVRPAAGNSHVHDPEGQGQRCEQCMRYSGKQLLSVIKSFS